MKLQISPIKRIDDALVVWPVKTPDVDIVMDPRDPDKFQLKEESIRAIYCFGLLGSASYNEIQKILDNIVKSIQKKGEIYIIEQDMDYMMRALLGGDISLAEFNKDHLMNCYLNQDEIVRFMEAAGFPAKEQIWWQQNGKFSTKNSEIVISGIKK